MSSPPTNSPAQTAGDRISNEEPRTAPIVPPACPFVKNGMALESLGGHGGASGKGYDDHGNGNREKFSV
ncbi:hypothetical protein GX48_00882 [Paracoccidioides brasiliensis]|nr:hypothetical protein GX48_00882 [Paracoccidioides brasiliensis]